MQIAIGTIWLLCAWTYVFVRLRRAWTTLPHLAKQVLIHSFPENQLIWFPLFLLGLFGAGALVGSFYSSVPPRHIFTLALLLLYYLADCITRRRWMKEATRIPPDFLRLANRLSFLWFAGLFGFAAATLL